MPVMTGPQHHRTVPLFLSMLCAMTMSVTISASETDRPNIILIVADDLGYGDLGCFGNTTVRTPHLDKLASQGVKLTHSVAAATMCTPSRAAFMTGRYSIRSGMIASHFMRAFPLTAAACGLPASELTIGEVAKKAGYLTAYLGKWHLGWSTDRTDPNHHHPLNQGFDYFYGIPLTNIEDFGDPYPRSLPSLFPNLPFQLVLTFMIILFSSVCLVRVGYIHLCLGFLIISAAGIVCGTGLFIMYNTKLLNSFMFRNYDIVEQPVHLPSVTPKLVKESEEFLQARHADHSPFLLMVSWLHVHTALATAPEFRGQSQHGPYGDAVEEMDWGTGRLMDMLEHYGMADNTLVYFTSDHGGAPGAKDLMGRTVGGSNRPFAGAKGDGSTEGSFRVPGLVRWPGHFPAGLVVREPVSLMDVLPTLADLLDVSLDSDVRGGHVMDGMSMVPLLMGQEKVSPHEFLFHYCQQDVHAVTYRPRSGSNIWKLMLREPDPNTRSVLDKCNKAIHLDLPKLYDLSTDPTAALPLRAMDHAQVVSAMVKAVGQHQHTVHHAPSQFAWWRLLWQPWNQPCCHFPTCACEDEKFKGLFAD